MRIHALYFIAAITLMASSAAEAATRNGGSDIWLQIIRLLAPGI